jgi:hypothetical protein
MPSGCRRSINKRERSADTDTPELVMRRRLIREEPEPVDLDDRPRAPSPCRGGSYVERIDGERPDEWGDDNWDEWLSSATPKRAVDESPMPAARKPALTLPIFAQTPPSMADPMHSWSARPARLAARLTARPTARRLNPAPTQFTALPSPAAPELLPGVVLWFDTATKWV